MLRDLLNLVNAVQIRRIAESSDGMGGVTASTTITTVGRASIWVSNSNDRTMSDKITKDSTHVLAFEYGAYTLTVDDKEVLFNGDTYQLKGNPDNVANRNELVVIGMELLK